MQVNTSMIQLLISLLKRLPKRFGSKIIRVSWCLFITWVWRRLLCKNLMPTFHSMSIHSLIPNGSWGQECKFLHSLCCFFLWYPLCVKDYVSTLQVDCLLCISLSSQTNRLKLENSSKSFDCINELIVNQGLQLGLNDFDNHLDDISSDWTNKRVNEKIAEIIESWGKKCKPKWQGHEK